MALYNLMEGVLVGTSCLLIAYEYSNAKNETDRERFRLRELFFSLVWMSRLLFNGEKTTVAVQPTNLADDVTRFWQFYSNWIRDLIEPFVGEMQFVHVFLFEWDMEE